MSAIIHGAGAATALTTFHSKKLVARSRTNLPGRSKRCIVASGSDDGSKSFGSSSSLSLRHSHKLIPNNAVATKVDTSATTGHELLLFEALQEGLEEEMDRDPHVCVMGEDVGHYGGSYKVTKGLADKFGDLRPSTKSPTTVECFTTHLVVMGRQLGAEHSQRLESYFQSIPGIQMVACSTPYNAKGLMKAAIRSENPVILFEHVLLYNLKEKIPDEEYICNLEEAEMVRPGEHITILTYSRMRYHVMQAAKILVNKGYDPEVIDIRSLKPFDLYTIGNSVKKTHRDVPTPYAGTLEEWTVVQPAQIVTAVEQLCQ
ncbi:BnaA09g26420D [Brassica napus]|uniref:pyruvate dehydrogenase (acetyl-transferring) n=1 Tax=Brassica napus TaxID=3708 RepID=A0A078GLR5_BRANA|nr:BnaA09g26420D [Brassica napus]